MENVKVNKFGDIIVNEADIIQGLYTGKIQSFSNLKVDETDLISKFNSSVKLNADKIEFLSAYQEPTKSVEEVDKDRQSNWFIPAQYKNFDVSSWLLDQCKTSEEHTRVLEELEMFKERDMVDVLIFLKYLVDTMRENNIIWGVGRGSSVASFCLYLIGVHKVNPLKFNLDIKEFLKDE